MRKKKFGATGRFPEGKLNRDDEGEIQMGVRNDGTIVELRFGTPVTWLGMPPENARQLGLALVKHAGMVDGAIAEITFKGGSRGH